MKKYLLLPLMLAISACVPASHPGVVTRAAMEPASTSSLPAMKRFTVHQSLPAPRSNNDLSLDFIELSFRMESGKELPVFTRFEGPHLAATNLCEASKGSHRRRSASR